jgi:transposase
VIFTERLPDLVQPWARITDRLRSALQALGLATGGEVAARLAPKLGLLMPATTLLRCLRALSAPAAQKVRVLGLDDWAHKRGQTYGTILVDLERHRVIDLLPDRSKETVKAWLQQHPEIEVISRDRASTYADAARQGAPQAVQVADRFHLLKNVREKLQELLDRKRTCLPFVEAARPALSAALVLPPSLEAGRVTQSAASPPEKDTPGAPQAVLDQPTEDRSVCPPTTRERRRALNRDKRAALYEEVWALRRQGLSHYAIADALSISRPTVRRFLAAEQFPERASRLSSMSPSILDSSLPFLRERWQAGCHNGHQLFREAKARGYSGSQAQLGRLTTEWRKQLPPAPSSPKEPARLPPVPPPKRHRLSSQQAAWLFMLAPERLTPQQHQQLVPICQASEDLSRAYGLSQDFVTILKERKAQEFVDWLRRAKGSHVPELKSLAKSMQQDYAAIYAACSMPWSQGQTEGQVNKLKFVKRSMYGRAHFDLLRLRVLHAS